MVCNDLIFRQVPSGLATLVTSNVERTRCRQQRAMKQTGLLCSQDVDRVVGDSLDKKGEEMVVDDAKRGRIRFVNKAMFEEQKYTQGMEGF